jgi:membrane-associated PAP2 superfamily phosphatase
LLVLISLLLVLASVTCYQSSLDMYLARAISNLEGDSGGFPWAHSFWLDDLLHEGGRDLVKRLFFLNLALLLSSYFIKPLRTWRRAFLYVAVATVASTSIVSILKHLTTLPCPIVLTEFGGSRAWISMSQIFSPELPAGRCYPAGHASAGYAWICVAFLFPFGTRKFYLALIPGLLLGMIFGICQQFRGYHFLSHDIATLAVCWAISGLLANSLAMAAADSVRTRRMILSLEETTR